MASDLLTLTQVADEIGERPSRVRHAVNTYRIEAAQRAGIVRLFRRDQVGEIRAAVRRVAERAR